MWRRSGTYWISRDAIGGRRNTGVAFEVALKTIQSVETGTPKLPRLRIAHSGGELLLPAISGRLRAIDALRSVRLL
jgi:hypothetical protein